MSPSAKRFLSPDELHAEYGFSKPVQAKWRGQKTIPYKKLGGFIRYDRFEIDRWIEKHSVVSEESA